MDQKTYSFLRNLVNDSIDEMGGMDEITTTAATLGYQTPYAFVDKKRKRKTNRIILI